MYTVALPCTLGWGAFGEPRFPHLSEGTRRPTPQGWYAEARSQGRARSVWGRQATDPVQRENVGRVGEGETAREAQRPHCKGLEGPAEEFAVYTTGTGSPLSREVETFFKGAGDGLGNPDRAENSFGTENLQKSEPAKLACGLQLWPSFALTDWAIPYPLWAVVSICIRWSLASVFAEGPPVVTALMDLLGMLTSPLLGNGSDGRGQILLLQTLDNWQSPGQT